MEEIQDTLENNKKIRAMVLPSPTYEGVVMDIARLKKVTEKYNVILIVDEAHGAHFPFHEYFPKSAIDCGGDIVIQSTHKTLPAMTQTALLASVHGQDHPGSNIGYAVRLRIFQSVLYFDGFRGIFGSLYE